MSTETAAGSAPGLCLAGTDPYHPDALENPYLYYRTLRARGPVTYVPGRGIWLVPHYEHAAAVLRDYRRFISGLGAGYTRVPDHGYRYPLIDNDPPEHTRTRRAVQNFFGRTAIDELRPGVRAAANDLVEAAVSAGEVDAVTAFALPLPDRTIRLLTGIQPPDGAMATWGDAVGQLGAADLDAEMVQIATESLEWLKAVGVPALPAHCMGRTIMEQGGDNGALKEGQERLMMLDSIWLAGIDSSSSSLGNAIGAFADFPEQWDLIRDDPRLIPNTVEEVLRFEAPFRSFYRRTVAATDIGGVNIPPDSDVCVLLGAANRDPARFVDPDRFDVTRADARSHLSFGTSIHLCIGAPVARLELTELITALAARVHRFERIGEAVRAPNQAMRKYASLPVRLITR